MQDFRCLAVWHKAHALALAVYRETRSFPPTETYGLTSQLRRSAASIPANIAEGCGRGTDNDFRRFLQMAVGSASEVDYHLLLARDLGYVDAAVYESLAPLCTELRRMLIALVKRLRTFSRS